MAAILDFSLVDTPDVAHSSCIVFSDPKNMDVAVGILFLAGLQAEK